VDVQPLRVLVVDDDRDTADSYCVLLSLWGHRPFAAYDAASALSAARQQQPHVALLDVALPAVNGLELARRLRAEPGLDVLLVAVTGYGTAEDRARCAAAGFDHHLLKPVEPDALRGLLTEYAGRLSRRPALAGA
jgi:CheY-like chemotaxis protein